MKEKIIAKLKEKINAHKFLKEIAIYYYEFHLVYKYQKKINRYTKLLKIIERRKSRK